MKTLLTNPRKIFLLDAIGALLTALLLTGILIPFQKEFGMPLNWLVILAVIAFIFCAYSLTCYLLTKNGSKLLLLLIILANSTYFILSIALLIMHFQIMTLIGLTYFIAELVVILLVISLELKVYRNMAVKRIN